MNWMRGLLLILLYLESFVVSAQELKCQVEVNVDMLEQSLRQSADALQEAVSEYMNTTRFTDINLSVDQRIDCRLFFEVKDYNEGEYIVDLQVQSIRPVYNSSYMTPLINLKDKDIDFIYRRGDQLLFSKISMDSQLTGILDFYAYLILAMDADSFSPKGGEGYFSEARRVVQMGQGRNKAGWGMSERHSRGAILKSWIEYSKLRDLTYSYHRRGLDCMPDDVAKAREWIMKELQVLSQVCESDPMGIGLSMWRDTKLDEIANIFAGGTREEKENITELLNKVYPAEVDVIKRLK